MIDKDTIRQLWLKAMNEINLKDCNLVLRVH